MWQGIGRKINSDYMCGTNNSLIRDFFKSKIVIDNSILEIVKNVKDNNIQTGILSNTTAIMHSVVEELIDMKYFDYQFLSYKIGIEKPNKKISDMW